MKHILSAAAVAVTAAFAASQGTAQEPGLLEAVRNGDLARAESFIAEGHDPNLPTDGKVGSAPLHEAAAGCHFDIALLLLKAGADPNAADIFGRTPLHFAAHYGCWNISRLLLEFGADLDAPDEDGRTPLDEAADGFRIGHADVVRLLEAAVATD